jgi:putative Mn2+ efflux pump MntP
MTIAEILTAFGLALALAMDAFAVSIGLGLCGGDEKPLRRGLRVGVYFGAFQTGMTLLGYLLGWAASGWLQSVSNWVSAALLWIVGLHMLVEAIKGREPECDPSCPAPGQGDAPRQKDPSRGMTLVVLAVATSLDAFGVGMSLALVGAEVAVTSAIIGGVALGLSLVGVMLACRLAARSSSAGRIAEIIGALVIIGIGVKVALQAAT